MFVFFFNDTATTEIYTLSLHDALPICNASAAGIPRPIRGGTAVASMKLHNGQILTEEMIEALAREAEAGLDPRSEEHTSELQSRQYLVCRLLLEKKKPIIV